MMWMFKYGKTSYNYKKEERKKKAVQLK